MVGVPTMSLEATITALLEGLVDGRLYPDVGPDTSVYPFITYQQVGGRSLQYLEKTLPGHEHARLQVNVWAKTRLEANQLARAVAHALVQSPMPCETYGAFAAIYEPAIKKYGTRQDFGLWHPA